MNVLIIGLGSIAKKHIVALNKVISNAAIYALRSSKTADVYENVQNIFSLNELTVHPDFIIIANPTQMHGDTILECLKYNCPLFIEKPVLGDLTKAEKIINEINKRQLSTYVACNLRFHPAIVHVKNYLQTTNQRINEVNCYCGSYLPDWRPGKDFRKIYSANPEMGGGVHLDLIHELDYCSWLFGAPQKVISLKRNASSLKINAVDSAQYHLLYEDFTTNISLNYFRRDTKRELEIVFEGTTLKVNLVKCEVTDEKQNILFQDREYTIQQTYVQQITYFLDHIKRNTNPMNDVTEAVDVLKLVLTNDCA